MRSVRMADNRFGKLALLSGGALSFLFAPGAGAQTINDLPTRSINSAAPVLQADAPAPPAPPKPIPSTDDGLGQQGFYLEANSVTRDDKNNIWIARGQVEARYQGRVLRGDEVIYNTGTGAVTVNGHGQIISADGTRRLWRARCPRRQDAGQGSPEDSRRTSPRTSRSPPT